MSRVIAFERPGGDGGRTSKRPSLPINLMHLHHQTMGDRDLEREILVLFSQQAGLLQMQLSAATPEERKKLAHGFKGAAMAVGAFPIAECAANIIERPGDAQNLKRLTKLVDDVRGFIARFTR